MPPGYAYHLTGEWGLPFRADRIEALLAATPKHSPASFARLQADSVSLQMKEILPLLLQARPATAVAGEVVRELAVWDGDMAAARSEPLIASAWLRELTRLVYADELGDIFPGAWEHRAGFMRNVLADRDGAGRWCDKVATPAGETCAELIPQALDLALADLKQRYGDDRRAWRWGEAHHARSEHRPFARHPLLSRLFDIVVPTPGDAFTVNAGRNALAKAEAPFANGHAASLRAIYDLADPDRSRYIHSTGQSGNALSPLYRNFVERWAAVEYLPMSVQRRDAEDGGLGTLRLVPPAADRGRRPPAP